MNSLEAIEKLRIGHEQEAQQCIEIFRSFCQWYQSQYNFEQIESTFWNACIYLIEKQKCRIDEKFSEALLQLKSTEIDFISDKLEQGYSKEDLLKIMIPGIGIEKMEAICNLIKKRKQVRTMTSNNDEALIFMDIPVMSS